MDERRIARRYDIVVPVFVGLPGLRHRESPRGLTRDISTSGLYFTMDTPPRTGSRLELTLTLPGSLTGSADVRVEVLGRVVRVDPRVGARPAAQNESRANAAAGAARAAVGVAAHIERYEIISAHPASGSSSRPA